MLDFAIRHYTNNQGSLDDVKRKLYNKFYKGKNRGFTEAELKKVCEETAGNKLDEIFDYVYTTKELDYTKYFNYGGLDIEVADKSFTITPLKILMLCRLQYCKTGSVFKTEPVFTKFI